MKRFKTTVTRTDEYIIEIDETIFDEKTMEGFRQSFYNFNTYEEHAEHLAQIRARIGDGFIEGYGEVLVNGHKPWYLANENNINNAINIIIENEDQDREVEVEEIV